ncbi:MAG: hypothetical protein KDD45_18285, partial [Bdellovibrionales bacterium]|nr:hypothetical protein [Bdellovibrionales bacterium]
MADEKNLNTKTKSFFLSIENHSQFTMHYEIVKNILPRTTLYIHGNLASNRWWYPLLNEIDFANKMHAEENESKLSGNMILAEF